MKTALLLILCLWMSHFCYAQNLLDTLRSLPNQVADEPNQNYLDLMLKKSQLTFSNNLGLRNLYSLDEPMDKFLPCNIDQGHFNSCTAIVTAAALSIRENFVVKSGLKIGSAATNCFSPRYFWRMTKQWKMANENKEQICSSEISFYECFRAILKYGAVDNRICPYPLDSLYAMCDDIEPGTLVAYQDQLEFPNIQIASGAFRQALRQGFPVCISVIKDENYLKAVSSYPYRWIKLGQYPMKNSKHALLVVDFDEKQKLFKVWNSDRMTSQFLWMSYDIVDYSKSIVVAFTPSFDKMAPNSELRSGSSMDLDTTQILPDDSARVGHFESNIESFETTGLIYSIHSIREPPTPTVSSKRMVLPTSDSILSAVTEIANEQFSVTSLITDSSKFSNDKIETWIKPNYFRLFNHFKLIVNAVNESDQSVMFELRDKVTDQLLQPSIILHKSEFVIFRYGQYNYKISLLSIDHAGSRLNIRNPYAALFELINTNGTLEEHHD